MMEIDTKIDCICGDIVFGVATRDCGLMTVDIAVIHSNDSDFCKWLGNHY